MNNLEQIDSIQMAKIKDDIGSIFDALVVQSYKPKYPERIFVENFLPVFSGERSMSMEALNDWIGIAGSVTNEVDIVDPANKVLYSVPALLDTNVIDIASRDSRPLDHIYGEFDLRKNNIPTAAQAFLKSELTKKANGIIKQENNVSAERWKDILDRYGKLPKEEVKIIEDDDDELIYD